jgi:hypothetical protein
MKSESPYCYNSLEFLVTISIRDYGRSLSIATQTSLRGRFGVCERLYVISFAICERDRVGGDQGVRPLKRVKEVRIVG